MFIENITNLNKNRFGINFKIDNIKCSSINNIDIIKNEKDLDSKTIRKDINE